MAEQIILDAQAASTKKAYLKCSREYEEHRGDLPHSQEVFLSFLAKQSEHKAPTTLWTVFSHVKKYLLLEASMT